MLSIFSKNSSILFFIFALFPFVSFGLNSMDTQPFYIFFAFTAGILLIITGPVFHKSIHLLLILLLIIFTVTFFSKSIDFMYLRSIASYTGFFLSLIVSIIFFMRYGIPIKLIIFSNIIYLIVGIIQSLAGANKNAIFDFLVISNTFSSPTRGVIGLTPEPTMFAVLIFFFSWIILLVYDYKPNKRVVYLLLANILTLLFLTKSSMGFVFIITATFFFLINNLKSKSILIGVMSALIFLAIYIFIMQHLFPASRFVNLSKIFFALDGSLIERLQILINFDASINDRALNAIFPYLGFYQNNGIPGGIDTFNNMSQILVAYTNSYFWSGLGSNKILSFVGSFIYELGAIGIFCIIYFYFFMKDSRNSNRKIEMMLLFILLNSSIPVAFPFIPILMALMYYKKITNEY